MQPADQGSGLAGELISWMATTDPQAPPGEVYLGSEGDAVDGHVPALVAKPRTAPQVAAAMRFASTHGLSVVPVGGRTQMDWGGVLEGAQLLLDLSAMDRVLEYQPADMTVAVQAGCTLTELQEMLARNRQFLPVDPPLDPGATVGGMVATHAAGPLRLAYGTVRDYLLGMRLVRANGDLVTVGGRVVKNAAGYELTKLFTGSMGTLGVLVELTFMVRPITEDRKMLFIPVPHIDAAEPIVATLLDATLEPTLLEMANQPALDRLPAEVFPSDTGAPYGLFIGFMGSGTAVQWQIEYVQGLIETLPAPSGGQLQALTVPWDSTYQALVQARRATADSLVCRATMLSSDVATFIARAEQLFQSHNLRPVMLAHAGSGIVHIHIDPIPEDCKRLVEGLARILREAPAEVDHATRAFSGPGEAAGPSILAAPGEGDLAALRSLYPGNVVVESAPVSVRRTLPVWGNRPAHHGLSGELKGKLDPQGLLNPGRMLGG